ncbi:MAG: sensor domain-containing diguanylate cyclase [Gammaproteobacteria bacterium]|nr:MAG: sensor domain-containing diguanylate cyclase [Gammaproteobacteria bacterium]
MDNTPFVEASIELRQRFMTLLDSLASLRALTDTGSRPGDESDLLAHALEVLLENQDLERCSVFLLEGEELRCAVGIDWSDRLAPPRVTRHHDAATFRLGEGLMGRAAAEGEMQFCDDCAQAEGYIPIPGAENAGSLICVPIRGGGKVLGVLNVSHPDPGFFHPWQRNILEIFSSVLGQMLQNHRLLAQMEQQVRSRTMELERALAEAQDLKRRFEELSVIDDLTRLHNRRFFFPEATAEIARAIRNGEDLCVVLLDLDFFKVINDSYGHAMGDEVLVDVAAMLKEQTREGDILARFGGEEFIIALPSTGIEGARPLAERICEAARQLRWQAGEEVVDITVSIGLSCLSRLPERLRREGDSEALLNELLKQADIALYEAKKHGRDQVWIAPPAR